MGKVISHSLPARSERKVIQTQSYISVQKLVFLSLLYCFQGAQNRILTIIIVNILIELVGI